jgi:hypothetical protein
VPRHLSSLATISLALPKPSFVVAVIIIAIIINISLFLRDLFKLISFASSSSGQVSPSPPSSPSPSASVLLSSSSSSSSSSSFLLLLTSCWLVFSFSLSLFSFSFFHFSLQPLLDMASTPDAHMSVQVSPRTAPPSFPAHFFCILFPYACARQMSDVFPLAGLDIHTNDHQRMSGCRCALPLKGKDKKKKERKGCRLFMDFILSCAPCSKARLRMQRVLEHMALRVIGVLLVLLDVTLLLVRVSKNHWDFNNKSEPKVQIKKL